MEFFKSAVISIAEGVGSAVGTVAGVVVGGVTGVCAGAVIGYNLGEKMVGEAIRKKLDAEPEQATVVVDVEPEVIPAKQPKTRKTAAAAAT